MEKFRIKHSGKCLLLSYGNSFIVIKYGIAANFLVVDQAPGKK
jgi:hypothetical protein